MSEFKDRLKRFLDYVEDLELKVKEAQYHIRRHLRAFPPEELECMALDGLIDWTEIPEDLRTPYARERAEEAGKKRHLGRCIACEYFEYDEEKGCYMLGEDDGVGWCRRHNAATGFYSTCPDWKRKRGEAKR